MRPARPVALVAIAAVCAFVVAACGSGSKPTSGEVSKPTSQILSDVQQAVTAAGSVHFSGHGVQGAQAISFELSISNGGGADGKFGLFGGSVEMIRIGPKLYVRGDSAFWQRFAKGQVNPSSIANKWVVVPATLQIFQGLTSLMNLSGVSAALDVQGQAVNQGLKTYAGQQVIALHDVARNGTLYLSATGKPYPVALVGGKSSVTITFDHWGEPVSIPSPPKGAVSLFGG